MGFAEKFKKKVTDLFTDEEEVIETREVEITEKEEHKLPTFMRKKIEKEEEEKEVALESKEEAISDRELVKTNSKFSFPVAFDEEDFFDTNKLSTQNVFVQEKEKSKTVAEIYAKKEEKLPTRFRPSPIISPVYGVLDKNYSKEDVLEKEEDAYEIPRPSKKIDFESVRKKAFGSLSDDIKDNLLCENCELLKEAIEQEKVDKDNLLYNMLGDKEDISLETAEENYYDFGVAYETPKEESKQEVVEDKKEEMENEIEIEEINIDNVNIEVSQEIKIINHNDEEPTGEKIEVKEINEEKDSYLEDLEEVKEDKEEKTLTRSEKNKDTSLENLELTDDLYNLIDSMYEERDD